MSMRHEKNLNRRTISQKIQNGKDTSLMKKINRIIFH